MVIVGGGMLGTMHAVMARRRGFAVVHLEREPEARGASVRNFGLVWVSGRRAGPELALALRARELWEEIAASAPGTGFRPAGSLTLGDLRGGAARAAARRQSCPTPSSATSSCSTPTACAPVNPALRGRVPWRAVLPGRRDRGAAGRAARRSARTALPARRWRGRYEWLPGREAVEVVAHGVRDQRGRWHRGDLVVLCTGANFTGVAGPHLAATAHHLRRVRLQMMQTAPFAESLTTSVADGDSLRYYPAYEVPSLALLGPQAAVAAASRAQLLLVQRADGGLTIGDTHAYDEPFAFDVDEEPYDHLRARAEALLGRPLPRVQRRWAGVYSEVTGTSDALPPVRGRARRGAGHRPGRTRHDLFARDRRGDVPAMSQHRISVACLDMAGTTVRDDGIVMAAFTDAITSFNLPVAEFVTAMKYVRATMGQSKIEVFRHILGSEGAAQAANAAFEAHYAVAVSGGEVAAIPGAEALFAECRSAGIKVCLSTGFSPATRDAIIAELGWGSLVDLVLSPADAGRGLPWPDMPLTALLRLGGGSVHELAVVGDTHKRRRIRACGRARGSWPAC